MPYGNGEAIYIVGVLCYANPTTFSTKCLMELLDQNHRLVEATSKLQMSAKQYLFHHFIKRQGQ